MLKVPTWKKKGKKKRIIPRNTLVAHCTELEEPKKEEEEKKEVGFKYFFSNFEKILISFCFQKSS